MSTDNAFSELPLAREPLRVAFLSI